MSVAIAVYFVSTCGVTLNFHFCMGRFSSVELYKQPGKSCSTCGMRVKNPKCCHDEIKLIKLQNVHQHSSLAYNHEVIQSSLIAPFCYFTTFLANEDATPNKITHAPPLDSRPDVYLLNGVFRI
jgi:hypothetical protein